MSKTGSLDMQETDLKSIIDYYLQQWKNLTPEIIDDLASYLTGLDNDRPLFNEVFNTAQKKVDYLQARVEQLNKIYEKHKMYMDSVKPKNENDLTLEEFLLTFRDINNSMYE